jgi:hypothetical protein
MFKNEINCSEVDVIHKIHKGIRWPVAGGGHLILSYPNLSFSKISLWTRVLLGDTLPKRSILSKFGFGIRSSIFNYVSTLVLVVFYSRLRFCTRRMKSDVMFQISGDKTMCSTPCFLWLLQRGVRIVLSHTPRVVSKNAWHASSLPCYSRAPTVKSKF